MPSTFQVTAVTEIPGGGEGSTDARVYAVQHSDGKPAGTDYAIGDLSKPGLGLQQGVWWTSDPEIAQRHGIEYRPGPSSQEAFIAGEGAEYRRAQEYEAAKTTFDVQPDVARAPIGTPTPTVTREQIEAKAAYVQSPTAQYATEKDFSQSAGWVQQYRNVGATGQIVGTKAENEARMAAEANEAAVIGIVPKFHGSQEKKIPLFDPTTGKPNIMYTSPAVAPEFKYDPKYGLMVRGDIGERAMAKREESALKSTLPTRFPISTISQKSRQIGESVGAKIRGFKIDTSFIPQEIRDSPGYKGGSYLFSLGKESTARFAEFAGIIPGTAELMGKTLIKEPKKLPGMIAVGGIAFVGGTAKQAEKDPAQFISDIVVTTGLIKGMGKVKGTVTDTVKFSGKTFVPPESIIEPQVLSGAKRFPLALRGTTGAQLVREFKNSRYRLPGTEEKIGGWHATPEEFAKATKTAPGTSESPGLYIAPSTSPHFWKIDKQFKLFGIDAPPESPAGLWISLKDITRAPAGIRKNMGSFNKFLNWKAEKGKAYISSAFERGVKPEKEAIIPPETPLERASNDFYTEFKGKKVPLMEYSVTGAKKPLAEPEIINPHTVKPGNLFGKYKKTPSEYTIYPHVVKPENLFGAGVVLLGVGQTASGKPPEETTFGELSRKQARIESEYRIYKEPIFTPTSFLLSSYKEKSSTRSIVSSLKRLMRSSTISDARRSETRSTASSKLDVLAPSITKSEARSIVSSKPDVLSPSKLDSRLSKAISRTTSPPSYRPTTRAPPYKPLIIPPYKPPKVPIVRLSKNPVNFKLTKKNLQGFFKWTVKNRLISLKDL